MQALKPEKDSSRKFIEDGVRKGKYQQFPNPAVQGEMLYTLKSWTKVQDWHRVSSCGIGSEWHTHELYTQTEV